MHIDEIHPINWGYFCKIFKSSFTQFSWLPKICTKCSYFMYEFAQSVLHISNSQNTLWCILIRVNIHTGISIFIKIATSGRRLFSISTIIVTLHLLQGVHWFFNIIIRLIVILIIIMKKINFNLRMTVHHYDWNIKYMSLRLTYLKRRHSQWHYFFSYQLNSFKSVCDIKNRLALPLVGMRHSHSRAYFFNHKK
jgi:hypothetical protein